MKLQTRELKTVSGSFATIFTDESTKKAFKLFKSYNHPDFDGTGKEELGLEKFNQFRRQVFATEIEAYELASQSQIVSNHCPKYYGKFGVDAVFENGQDTTNHYLIDCCIEMEMVFGTCSKILYLLTEEFQRSRSIDIQSIINEFCKIGIGFTRDSSAIYNDDEFKIIDFATVDWQTFEPIIGE